MLHAKTPQFKNKHHRLHGPVVCIRCVSAAEHHPAEYFKTGKTKLRKHLPRRNYHEMLARISSRCQAFENLLSKPSEDASQKSSWNLITPNKSKSSGSFSTVRPIVNGCNWRCTVRDLEHIIVLVFLAFNFILQRHTMHWLTLPMSKF